MSTGLESLYRMSVEQNPIAIMITDTDGNIVYVNPQWTSLTGYTQREVVGENPRLLQSGKTELGVYKDLWQTITSGKVWYGDLINKRKDGEIYVESIFVAPLRSDAGRTTHYLGVWQDVTELREGEKKLAHAAHFDFLTGQYNRGHILERLEVEVERAARYKRPLSAMMIDMDDSKAVNDEHGHLVGDRILKAFSTQVAQSIRKMDLLGRYGGDEFLVVLPEATLETSTVVAKRIQQSLADYRHDVVGDVTSFTCSIGLMSFSDAEKIDKTLLIEKIDRALMKAKRAGKNQVVVE
ncbi:MAG: diguanylate cyclase [Candidatus Omnitrophota bacterium]|nr:diguanylate cyclase [Candidatus Omnitrophota bacterium]